MYSLVTLNEAGGPYLVAGGQFALVSDAYVRYIARGNGKSWLPLQQPHARGAFDEVIVVPDANAPAGQAMYACGIFTIPGVPETRWITKWDGARWSSVGPPLSMYCYSLAFYDDAWDARPALFADAMTGPDGGHLTGQAVGDMALGNDIDLADVAVLQTLFDRP